MSMFDDLRDPLGPPAGDALGAVLGRARRRRIVGRSAVAAVTVVAVVGVVASASALRAGSNSVQVRGTGSSVPQPAASSTSSAPTSTSTSTSSSSSSSTSSSIVSSITTIPGFEARWTDPHVLLTPSGIGAVHAGMTVSEAQVAAGVTLDGAADGAIFPTTRPAGFPYLFVGTGPSRTLNCFGAEIQTPPENAQIVSTDEGFHLGGTVDELKAIYGDRAHYVPAPTGGISPRAGYVVSEPDGNLAFVVDPATATIVAIKGGNRDLSPSSCNG